MTRYRFVNLQKTVLQPYEDLFYSKVDVYELCTTIGVGYEYTLRCTACNSRFSYASFYNAKEKGHFLYENQRDLLYVTERVYWSRQMTELLINNM